MTKEQQTKRLQELRASVEEKVKAYNEAFQEKKFDESAKIDAEITEAINQIGGIKHATEENRAKIERTVEWLNSHMEQHKIRINMRG